jgi:hypothetical protein
MEAQMQSETCIDFVDLCIGAQHVNYVMCQMMRSLKLIEDWKLGWGH